MLLSKLRAQVEQGPGSTASLRVTSSRKKSYYNPSQAALLEYNLQL